MNGFKVILLIGLMSMLGITTTAVAGGTTLFILLNNGNVEEYALQQKKPVIGFDGECVQIHSATVTVTTPYRYSDIKKLYFDVITSGSPVEPSQLDPTVKIADPKDAANTFFFAYDGIVWRGRKSQSSGLFHEWCKSHATNADKRPAGRPQCLSTTFWGICN